MSLLYDPRLPEVVADPYPVFHRLREDDPVHWSEILGGWVLTRYADVKAALSDPRLSADRITPFARSREAGGDNLATLLRLIGLWAVFTDPPRHTRLRGLMNLAFTSRAVERLRPQITRIVSELLAAMDARGGGDLIRDFAYPLPVAVIADMLGVPREDSERFKAWSDELATFVGSAFGAPDKYARAGRSAAAMADYFRVAIAERRASPRDDIMSALTAARDRGEALSEDEVVASCMLLLFAGHETTTNLIGNAALAFMRNPEPAEAVRADVALAVAAVEEGVRYDGPTQAMVRVATDEVKIGGTPLPRGARIFTMINAANRDPRQFPDPDRLDVRRELGRHIAFGYGIHFCLGAPLARLEGQIALPAVLARRPRLACEEDRVVWLDSLVFRGVRALPVAFRG